jgi:uncharacterized membrane protein YidH (DUF202 family)
MGAESVEQRKNCTNQRTFNIDSLVKDEASGCERRGHWTNNTFSLRVGEMFCVIFKILTFIIGELSWMEAQYHEEKLRRFHQHPLSQKS